jgi:hypothetical protein
MPNHKKDHTHDWYSPYRSNKGTQTEDPVVVGKKRARGPDGVAVKPDERAKNVTNVFPVLTFAQAQKLRKKFMYRCGGML